MKRTLKIVLTVALIAIVACVFFACVPSDMEKAKSKMEDAGYTVASISRSYEGLEGAFSATKVSVSEGSGTMFAFYFESASAAKDAYDEIKGDNKDEDMPVKQNGKWVYLGTSAAIKAFEK